MHSGKRRVNGHFTLCIQSQSTLYQYTWMCGELCLPFPMHCTIRWTGPAMHANRFEQCKWFTSLNESSQRRLGYDLQPNTNIFSGPIAQGTCFHILL